MARWQVSIVCATAAGTAVWAARNFPSSLSLATSLASFDTSYLTKTRVCDPLFMIHLDDRRLDILRRSAHEHALYSVLCSLGFDAPVTTHLPLFTFVTDAPSASYLSMHIARCPRIIW